MLEETQEDSMVKDVHRRAAPSPDDLGLQLLEWQRHPGTQKTTNAPTVTNLVTPNWIAPSHRYPSRTESATYAAKPATLRGNARTKTKEDAHKPNRLSWLSQGQARRSFHTATALSWG